MPEKPGRVRRVDHQRHALVVRYDGGQRDGYVPLSTPGADALRRGDPFEAEVDAGGQVVAVWRPDERPDAVSDFLAEIPAQPAGVDGYLNPYVMLQMPRRSGAGTWGDAEPPTHARLEPQLVRGTLRFAVTAESPLLLLDQSTSETDSALALRRDVDGNPQLDPTAVKGMLRSAFEAASVSRFGVFDHPEPLTIRALAGDALNLRPFRTIRVDDVSATFEVTTRLDPTNFTRAHDHAAPRDVWVPSYLTGPGLVAGRTHGDLVWAWIHLLRRPPRRDQPRSGYYVWRASALGTGPDGLQPLDVHLTGTFEVVEGVDPVLVQGRLVIGGHSIAGKHDERLYVLPAADGHPYVGLEHDVVEGEMEHAVDFWRRVIDSYEKAHKNGINPAPPGISLSRHVLGAAAERQLTTGTLGFARMSTDSVVTGIYPVLIGRLPFQRSPDQVLAKTQRPAVERDELSPADRMFGWVRSGSKGHRGAVAAHRGHLWVESVEPRGAIEVTQMPAGGLELATLSSPKPTQYRFYLKDGDDQPAGEGLPREPAHGYDSSNRRIPRKFYWPHRGLPQGYWAPGGLVDNIEGGARKGYRPSQLGGRHREYVAPPGTAPTVSRRIQEWIDVGATYEVTLRFDGVEREHLGLLLWLLTDEHVRFGLGGGKPFGFGTVRTELDRGGVEVSSGTEVAEHFRRWPAAPAPHQGAADGSAVVEGLIRSAVESMPATYLDNLRRLRRVGTPPELPVHYPRPDRGPAAESYVWFVDNDRPRAPKLALPDVGDPTLHYT